MASSRGQLTLGCHGADWLKKRASARSQCKAKETLRRFTKALDAWKNPKVYLEYCVRRALSAEITFYLRGVGGALDNKAKVLICNASIFGLARSSCKFWNYFINETFRRHSWLAEGCVRFCFKSFLLESNVSSVSTKAFRKTRRKPVILKCLSSQRKQWYNITVEGMKEIIVKRL